MNASRWSFETNHCALVVMASGLALAPAALGQSPLEEPFPAVLDLPSLDGQIGFSIPGVERDARMGYRIAHAGDVNGDGVDDLIIGVSPINTVYVVFGRRDGFPPSFDLTRLDGSNGFVMHGVSSYDRCGSSVASAGDINGDGVDDIIVGATDADGAGSISGAGYIVFGRRGAFPASISLSSLDGSDGFALTSPGTKDQTGLAVAPAGDFNNDGVDDVVITGTASPAGRYFAGSTYVIFGRAGGGFPAVLDLASLDGSNGFALAGAQERELSGFSVATLDDINGDGLRDLVIGAPYHDSSLSMWSGMAYVVFGRPHGFDWPAMFDLATIDGANGFVLDGSNYGYAGWAVASAGDINGDGMDDLIIGSPASDPFGYEPYEGAAYVVFGRPSGGFPASMSLTALDGQNGFAMCGAADLRTGSAVSSAGDLDGDGVGDLLIGESRSDFAYVVFGRSDRPFPRSFFPPGDDGFALRGSTGDDAGAGVALVGDVNGDGRKDLAVGAPWADVGGLANAGRVSIVFGRDLTPCAPDLDGDGALTIFDFLAFQNAFDDMDPIADFDGDGDLTIFDFLAFQNAFDAGCP